MRCFYCGHPLVALKGKLLSVRTGLASCLGKPGHHSTKEV